MESPEYRTLFHHTTDLRLALQDDLTQISGFLFKNHLITQNQSCNFRNTTFSKKDRVADLVDGIQVKVKQDVNCYYTFISILNSIENGYYSSILRKLEETLNDCQKGNSYYGYYCFKHLYHVKRHLNDGTSKNSSLR